MSKHEYFKLNTLCSKITDGSHYSPKGIDSGFPMLSVKDMNNNGFSYDNCKYISEVDYLDMVKSDCKPLLNDVLIAKDGSYLKHVFVIKKNVEQAILSSIGILRPDINKINSDYLKYYLQTQFVKETVEKKYVSGSALPRIILKNFGEIDIIYKKLPDQFNIAKILSDLDAKIELNNKINAELEAMAKLIYDYWFVQFEFPHEFKTTKTDKNATVTELVEVKPYKSSGGKMVWNEELKREVPVGWEVKKANEIIEVKDGTHESPKTKNEGFRLITSKNLKNEGLDFENANLISEEDYTNINRRSKVETGDILFSMIGNIGTVYKVEEKEINFAIKNVALFKTSQLEKYKNFIYMFLKSVDMDRYMKNVISGSIQKFIGLNGLRNSSIFVDDEVVGNYNQCTISIFQMLEKNKLENQKLASLRDWLLPMLMNGQVKVGEVAEELGMVAEGKVEYGKTR